MTIRSVYDFGMAISDDGLSFTMSYTVSYTTSGADIGVSFWASILLTGKSDKSARGRHNYGGDPAWRGTSLTLCVRMLFQNSASARLHS